MEKFESKCGDLSRNRSTTPHDTGPPCISVLLLVAQLDPLPDDFEAYEGKACRSLFTGPTGWMTAGCLKEFKSFKFPKELPDIRSIAIAAKARVVRFECLGSGGLEIRRRAHDLSSLQANGRCSLWHWHWVSTRREHSFLYHLRNADGQLRSKLDTLVVSDLNRTSDRAGKVASRPYSGTIRESRPNYILEGDWIGGMRGHCLDGGFDGWKESSTQLPA